MGKAAVLASVVGLAAWGIAASPAWGVPFSQNGVHGGFRPGEWQMVTVTHGPVGSGTVTAMQCQQTPFLSTVTNAQSAPGGTVHDQVTNEKNKTVVTYTVGKAQQGSLTYYRQSNNAFRVKGGGYSLYPAGKESYQVHGRWVSAHCLAHPPAPVSHTTVKLPPAMLQGMAKLKQEFPNSP